MDKEAEARIRSAQDAYEATAQVYQRAGSAIGATTLKAVFGAVAGLASSFFTTEPLIPLLLLQGGIILGAYEGRNRLSELAEQFRDATAQMGADGKYILRDIDIELKKVKPHSLSDVNPVEQWQKNQIGVIQAGIGFLFLGPAFIIGAAAMMPYFNDITKCRTLRAAALKGKEELERLHPLETLIPQG